MRTAGLGAPSTALRAVPLPVTGRIGVAALLLLASPVPLSAQSKLPPADYADRQLADPAKEAEAKALMETLRCIVCQGQSIADSDAEMAGDMRAEVRRRIGAGEDAGAVRAWFVARYGNWVSYDPGMSALTWPLWAAPLALLALGFWLARSRFRRR